MKITIKKLVEILNTYEQEHVIELEQTLGTSVDEPDEASSICLGIFKIVIYYKN